jgi:hypothetical protein
VSWREHFFSIGSETGSHAHGIEITRDYLLSFVSTEPIVSQTPYETVRLKTFLSSLKYSA